MSGRLTSLVVKLLPFNVRYRIVFDELVRTPRGTYNSAGVPVEELLRNMLRERKGSTMADTIRITEENFDDLVTRVKGRKVVERFTIENSGSQDGSEEVHAFNLRVKSGEVERAYIGDILLVHADGGFDLMPAHEAG